jgi:hypothetical protein
MEIGKLVGMNVRIACIPADYDITRGYVQAKAEFGELSPNVIQALAGNRRGMPGTPLSRRAVSVQSPGLESPSVFHIKRTRYVHQ